MFLAPSDDIALPKPTDPVNDVAPVALYKKSDEASQIVEIVGKGATGTGAVGHDPKRPIRAVLRRAFNTISNAYGRWFGYVFDESPRGLPLEGMFGNGDSGGPVLIQSHEHWLLAGLASWKVAQGDVRTARPGRYGQTACHVLLSHYLEWIDTVTSRTTPAESRGAFEFEPARDGIWSTLRLPWRDCIICGFFALIAIRRVPLFYSFEAGRVNGGFDFDAINCLNTIGCVE